MADNVAITAGSGTTIKTDDVSGVHYQQVKLVDGTLDATAVVAVDVGAKANALRIAPANDITDATYIGDIKFGESLPVGTNEIGKLAAGTAAIGKLASNSGVDIGDVTLNAGTAEIGKLAAGTAGIGKLTANTGVDIGDVDVLTCKNTAGDIAHSSGDSGNPVKVGGKAYNLDGTAPGTVVTEADRAHFITDVYGRQFVETTHPNLWKATDNQATAQTNTELKGPPGAGLSLYITDIIISNGATLGNIKFVEDSGGTPVDIIEVMYFAVNGGAVINLKTPLKITANKNFGYTSVDVSTHSITISGFIAP